MSAKKPFLSIVIPAHNNYIQLRKLITTIKNSAFTSFNDIEIIIVDDGSSDVDKDYLAKKEKSFCPISFVALNKNKGPAVARNTGVKNAKGNYIVFLDADVELKKVTLKNAYNFFKHKKGNAFTGIWDKKQRTKAFFPQFKALRDYTYWFIEREENARYYLFSTRIAGIEKKLFTKIGGFSSRYAKATVEDIELTYKIEKYTKILFEPQIVVHHEFEPFFPLAKKYYLRSRDWIKLYMKRLRFDPVATSKNEAKKSIIAGLFIIFLLLSCSISISSLYLTSYNLHLMSYNLYPISYILYLLSLLLLSIFLFMEFPFLKYLYKEKGPVFTLISVPTALILYFIIDLGSTVGLIEYWIRK